MTNIDKAGVNDFVIYSNGYTTNSANSLFTGSNEIRAFAKTDGSLIEVRIPDDNLDFTNALGYVILEYTKTTDTANSSSNSFKSYLHYVPSSSTTEELISVDLKDTGVRFLEGYNYDSTTDSCTKN